MIGAPGPRDWAPPETASYATPRDRRLIHTGGRSSRSKWRHAWVAAALGLASLVIAFMPMVASAGTMQGFVLTSIGAYAIASGVMAMRSAAWPRRPAKRMLGLVGVTTGSVATLLMVLQTISFYSSTGSAAPPLPFALNPAHSQAEADAPSVGAPLGSDAAGTTAAPSGLAAPEAPASEASAKMQMIQALGTLAYALEYSRADDGAWPRMLGTTSAGEVFVALPQPEARTLVVLPPGTELSYWTSADYRSWGARLSSLTTPGLAVAYDSVSGMVATQ